MHLAFGTFLCCVYACICTCLYVKACTSVCTVYVQEQFSNPPSHQDSAISLDQFPLNLDELLMPTFCFLLMGKSFEMDFLSSQWIRQLFKVSILFPDIAPVERRAHQDSWHSDIVALTLSQILNPACINAYSLIPFTHIPPGSHVYTGHTIAMCYIVAA